MTRPPGARQDKYEQGRNPHRWQALAVCLVAGFMTLLDISIVDVG